MAVCFVHLLPEAFEAAETACHTELVPCEHSIAHNHTHEHRNHFPLGSFVAVRVHDVDGLGGGRAGHLVLCTGAVVL